MADAAPSSASRQVTGPVAVKEEFDARCDYWTRIYWMTGNRMGPKLRDPNVMTLTGEFFALGDLLVGEPRHGVVVLTLDGVAISWDGQ